MVVRCVGRSVIAESARVISAFPAAKALSTARHIVASQTVLIMLCPKPVAKVTSASIRAVKGQVDTRRSGVALKSSAKVNESILPDASAVRGWGDDFHTVQFAGRASSGP